MSADLPLLIRGMRGLGDNIYQRGFVRALPGAYLDTPWPELYEGLDVHCVRAATSLRTQAKNVRRSRHRWAHPPSRVREMRIGYGHADLRAGSIIGTMRRQFGVDHPVFDLPDFGPSPQAGRYAVIRPVTVRTEWRNEARNPDAGHIAQAAQVLRRRGYTVVSVADLAAGAEWAVEPLPEADITWHAGELDICRLLALVQRAALVVGGVGWIVPACIAAQVPLYCVLGGHGGHNAPERITDPRMDLSRVGWAMPDAFCRCSDMRHACRKGIGNFNGKFEQWMDQNAL